MISDVLTTTSGEAIDIVRVMSLVAFAAYLGLAIYDVVFQKNPFRYQDFGIGLGAVITATGVGIKMNTDNNAKGTS